MAEAARESPFVRLVGLPGRLLDRASPTGRIVYAVLALIVMALAGAWTAHRAALRGLPDVGPAADPAALLPPEANRPGDAVPLYREAIAGLAANGGRHDDAVMATWRRATERPDAWIERAPGIRDEALGRELAAFAEAALVRAQTASDPGSAWGWFRAVLRASRHLGRHGGWEARTAGLAVLEAAADPIRTWAGRDLPPALARRAVDDLLDLDAMTPPPSTTWRHEFARLERELDAPPPDPDGLPGPAPEPSLSARVVRYLGGEPERSRRVLRLIAANWLAVCDRNPAGRPPPTFSESIFLWDLDPAAPLAARALPADRLARYRDASEWPRRDLPDFLATDLHFEERALRGELVLEVARRLYAAERGSPPEDDGLLIGPYLKSWPPGADPYER
jgi:hypothetical protein